MKDEMTLDAQNYFLQLCEELSPYIKNINDPGLQYHEYLQKFVSNIKGIKEGNWHNISDSYNAILDGCLKDKVSLDQLTKVSDILISKVNFPMQEILKSVGRSKLFHAQEDLNAYCSDVLQEVKNLTQVKELQNKIGPANANNLLSRIDSLQNIYESAEPLQKYKTLCKELKQLQQWLKIQEKKVENSNLSKIGAFISSAFQKLYYHAAGDKEGVIRHELVMFQISAELSGSKKTFADGLKDINQQTSSFVSKIKAEKKVVSNEVKR